MHNPNVKDVDQNRRFFPNGSEVPPHSSKSSFIDAPVDEVIQFAAQKGHWDNAPVEILERIFLFVDDTTLIKSVPAVCRKWRYVCRDYMQPMFTLSPEQWGVKTFGDHLKVKQEWLNCFVVRFTYAFKRSSTLWLGLACEKDAFEAVKLLLEGTGHDVDSILHTVMERFQTFTDTLLGIALRNNQSKIVGLLLRCGARIENIKDTYSLHTASQNGHLDIIRYLVDKLHRDPDKVDFHGRPTPLYVATNYGHLDVVRYLVEEARVAPNSADYDNRTLIYVATKNGHLDVVRYFVEEIEMDAGEADNDGVTLVWVASWKGHLDVVIYLVEKVKVNPDKANRWGMTPIHIATENGHLDVVRYLVENARADPDKIEDTDRTPLRVAIELDQTAVANYLCSIGARD